MDPRLKRLVRIARDVVVPALQKAARTRQHTGRTSSSGSRSTPASSSRSGTGVTMPSFDRGAATGSSHVDARRGEVDTATARPKVTYAPVRDDDADPGEVVWAWVPYEEDASQGKDRPVLLIARDRKRLYGLMLTSQDHDRDAADEARHGRYWMDVGAGGWDRERRPSEVRLDRLLTLATGDVRREGAALDRPMFERVIAAADRFHSFG